MNSAPRFKGHGSEFLRVIPRVSTRDVVAEPLLQRGATAVEARVLALLAVRRAAGAAMVGIFHDPEARSALATGVFSLPKRSQAA